MIVVCVLTIGYSGSCYLEQSQPAFESCILAILSEGGALRGVTVARVECVSRVSHFLLHLNARFGAAAR
jgi:hypothetical protein